MPGGRSGSSYWRDRFKQLEAAQNRKGADTYRLIEEQYRQAQKELEAKINAWYQRFATNNGMSMAEARKMLRDRELAELKWDVKEYIKRGQENAFTGQWMKELENASARFHISRLEALKLQTQQSLELMFGNQLDSIDAAMKRIYLDGYYHTAYELQKGFRIGWDIAALDQRQIEKVIRKPWAADGKNFSERVWGNKEKLITEVHRELTQDILLGRDPQKAIDNIARKMNASKNNAGRLVMTEEAYFSSAAQKDCFRDLGVEQYEIVATLDSHTSDICQSLDGQVFPMKDFEPGITAPPFHVYCRSTTVPYFDDDFSQVGERAARDADTGKTYYVPDNMTYKEWKESFVDGGDKPDLQKAETDNSTKQDPITDYIASRKKYDEQVQKLAELEKQSDEMLDAYMSAMETPQAAILEQAFNAKYDETESFKQVVKDMKAVLSGKEAQAVRQVEKNLAVKAGIPINRIEMTGLQYDTANTIYNSYKTVLDKYPELKDHLSAFKYDGIYGEAYAGCVALTGDVRVHGIFSNFEQLVQAYADDVAAGYHPVGTDYRSIIVHELGHALDGYMTRQRLYGGYLNAYGDVRSSEAIQKEVLARLGYVPPSRADLKAKGYTFEQINDIIIKDRKKFITHNVSEYAADSEKEFFAECFAEYVMSSEPREAAKIFGEIIDSALGR